MPAKPKPPAVTLNLTSDQIDLIVDRLTGHLYKAAVVMGVFAANCGPIRDAAEGQQPEYEAALRTTSRMARDMNAEMIRRAAEA